MYKNVAKVVGATVSGGFSSLQYVTVTTASDLPETCGSNGYLL